MKNNVNNKKMYNKKLNRELPKGIREKNGSYEARASINGISICLHSKNLEQLIEDFDFAKEQARKKVDYRKQNVTLDEWYDEWFENVKKPSVKESSVAPIKRNYKNTFGFYLGTKKIKDIEVMDVQKAMVTLKENGVAVSSIRQGVGQLQHCLEFAKACKYISVNPAIAIKVPWKNEESDVTALTKEEQRIFYQQLYDEDNWYKEMLHIMLLTGLRVGEVGSLTWNDVDFKGKCIHVRTSLMCQYDEGVKTQKMTSPKTVNSERIIPFIENTEELLLAQKDKIEKLKKRLGNRWRADSSDIVFANTMGNYCIRHIVEKEINKIVEHINKQRMLDSVVKGTKFEEYRKVTPHVIRHTFATRCFEKGFDAKIIQSLLGHSNYNTTMNIYVTVSKELLKKAVAKEDNVVDLNIELPNKKEVLPNVKNTQEKAS